jgi:hypothetical protein
MRRVMPEVQHPDLSRALRALGSHAGVSAAAARTRDEALAMIARDTLAAPAFAYRIHPATRVGNGMIDVGAAALRAPVLAADPGELVAVAAAVCTLGIAFQRRISDLFIERRRSLALALDTVGNELLFRLADRATAAIRRDARRRGYGIGIEISPGDPGMPLDQQAAVLALAGTPQHGVAATEAGMLTPVQSLSLLVAIGRNLRQRSSRARCACCPSRDRCTMN